MSTDINFARLRHLGYTTRQALWLRRVMQHAGVFLRRQFVAYLHATKSGALDQRLVARLVQMGHASVLPYQRRERMYHLRSRTLYAAIDCEHSRLRRPLPPFQAAQGLLVLDFMATEPREYVASENEKVRYFTSVHGLPLDVLPHRVYRSATDPTRTSTRYFADRHPVTGDSDLVRFVIADVAPRTAAVFAAFLENYRALLEALPQVELVYLTGRQESATAAARLHLDRFEGQRAEADIAELEALHEYFSVRRALDTRQYGQVTSDALERQERHARRFAAPHYAARYDDWLRGGIVALTRVMHTASPAAPRVMFRHVPLPYHYFCLGVPSRFAARPSDSGRLAS